MTDHEDEIILGKLVFDDKNQEWKSWACLGQTCSRSSIVFLSQFFVVLLIIFGCFRRNHLSEICNESIAQEGFLFGTTSYIYHHQEGEQVVF